jgi:hypothetical protein
VCLPLRLGARLGARPGANLDRARFAPRELRATANLAPSRFAPAVGQRGAATRRILVATRVRLVVGPRWVRAGSAPPPPANLALSRFAGGGPSADPAGRGSALGPGGVRAPANLALSRFARGRARANLDQARFAGGGGYPLARHLRAATMLTFHSWGEDVVDITQQVVWCNVHNILAPAVKC